MIISEDIPDTVDGTSLQAGDKIEVRGQRWEELHWLKRAWLWITFRKAHYQARDVNGGYQVESVGAGSSGNPWVIEA